MRIPNHDDEAPRQYLGKVGAPLDESTVLRIIREELKTL